MRQSTLFSKTRKEAPKDEVSRNAELLIRAGYIHKEMAGVYDFLPLGLLTLNNVIGIIRDEMNLIGGQELIMSALQPKETWEPTNQWDDAEVDVWFKTTLKNGTELGLAVTHEPALTKLAKEHINSYRDLPKLIYQFQTKFRNETRAKSGIMRTREFVMKDLYSFASNEGDHQKLYNLTRDAYVRIFKRCGLGDRTYLTRASGGMFSEFSHEFQTITDAGEDVIYINKEDYGAGLDLDSNRSALNKEILPSDANIETDFIVKKSVEVGNIFTLGTRFSDALDLKYRDEQGNILPVFMGSYGIGPARLMGTVAEVFADDKGLVWPESIAPFKYHLVSLPGGDDAAAITALADKVYAHLQSKGITVLYDDRDLRAGEKFADSDLMGIPHRIVVGKKSVASGDLEVVSRKDGAVSLKKLEDIT